MRPSSASAPNRMRVNGMRQRLSSSVASASSSARTRSRSAPEPTGRSAARDDPDRMHDTGNVAEDGEDDVDPEMLAEPHLKKHAKRRQDDREDDADEVHGYSSRAGITVSAPAGSVRTVRA